MDSLTPLQASLSRLFLSWRTRRAPSTGGIHWRFFAALLAGPLTGGTSRTSATVLALSTGPRMFLLSSCRQSWGTRRGHLQIPGLAPLGSWCGRAVLAPVQPVVPFTGAIRRALNRWCLQQWRSTALFWPTGCLPSFLPQGGSSSL